MQHKVWAMKFFAPLIAAAAMASPANSQLRLQPSQITVTSTIPNGWSMFPLSQISDGISDDVAPYNGFNGTTDTTGTISFTFDRAYSLTAVQLWNDVNVQSQGVESYSLRLFNSQNAILGTVGPFTTTAGQIAPSVTSWSNGFPNVKKVDLIIHSIRRTGINRVEIREVGFEVLPEVTSPPTQPTDGYQCYSLLDRGQRTAPRRIEIVDQFGRSRTAIGQAIEICNPAKMDSTTRPAEMRSNYPDHLVCYAIVDRKLGTSAQQRLKITNRLGENVLTSGQAEKICLVSTKEHLSPPPPPPPPRRP